MSVFWFVPFIFFLISLNSFGANISSLLSWLPFFYSFDFSFFFSAWFVIHTSAWINRSKIWNKERQRASFSLKRYGWKPMNYTCIKTRYSYSNREFSTWQLCAIDVINRFYFHIYIWFWFKVYEISIRLESIHISGKWKKYIKIVCVFWTISMKTIVECWECLVCMKLP